jgi:hypothetical protein
MGRRRSGSPPISLFSFQDIITSVTGIMILVTLLMSVELVRRPLQEHRPKSSDATPTEESANSPSQELAELQRRKDRNDQAMRELETASTPRKVAAAATNVDRVGRVQVPQLFDSPQRVDDLCEWAKGRDRNGEYFVLIIKPSGIKSFPMLQSRLKQQGFDLGFDVLAANQTALDRNSGAVLNGTP